MRPFLLQEPQGSVIPVEELRDICRVATEESDDYLRSLEKSAVAWLDGYSGRLGRCILSQRWALPLVGQPEAVSLPFPDCRDFKVEEDDGLGNWSGVPDVTTSKRGDHLFLTGLPEDTSSMAVTCTAGWDTAYYVHDGIKQAIRMMVAHWYDNRSAVATGQTPTEVPLGVEALISPMICV